MGHEISHCLCGLVLDLSGGVGIGAEGEACVVVAQHTADCFDVHAVLEGYCGKGVAQGVQRNVLQGGILEDLLVQLGYRVRMVHLAGGGGWEHVLVIRMFAVLLNQEVYGFLGDGHSADGGFGFGSGEGQLSVRITDILLADEDRFVFDVQVSPEEGNQLTFPEAADQRQVEHREEASGVGGVEVGFHILWVECLSLEFLNLGSDAVIGRIAGDQTLLDGSFEGAVEHEVDAADGGAAQARALILPNVDPAALHQVFVELLEVAGGQLGEFDLTNPRNGVGFDHQLVAVCCGKADVGLGVEIVPGAEPSGYGVFFSTDHIEVLDFFQDFGQLRLDFCLGLAEDIFDNSFTGGGIVSGGVAAFPAAIASLADVSFAVCTPFCHQGSLLSSNSSLSLCSSFST